MGLNICYDSCFPSIIRDTARLGPDIVALPTVDPGSPNGFFAANHAAFSSIRSAEEGVSLIRADGCAYSTITDPYGSIVGQLDTRADRWAVGRIPLHGHWTIYKWAGDWFLYFCGVIVVWVLVTGRMAKTSRVVGIRE
jgi:apolipoprotein N-acyltransferase